MNQRTYKITTDKLQVNGKLTDAWIVTATSIEMPGMTFDLATFFSKEEAETFLRGQQIAEKYKSIKPNSNDET